MAAAPPPIVPPRRFLRLWLRVIITLYIFLLCAAVLSWWIGSSDLLFIAQMGLLTTTLCLIPTVAYLLVGERRIVARVIVETLLFVALLLGFSLWVFGTAVLRIWIAYAVTVILLLEAGGHMIQWYLVSTLERLSTSVLFTGVQSASRALERMFHRETILYVSVPLGLIIGTTIGLIRTQSSQAIIILSLQLVLLMASFILLCFLIYAFVRITDPLFVRTSTSLPEISEERLRGGAGPSGKVFRVVAPISQPDTVDQKQRDFDLASVVTDLRKIYLYDALHNLILIVAFVATMLVLWGVTIDIRLFIVGAVGGAFVFNQLPYMIGQSRLRREVLKNYRNAKRVDMEEELKKYAPLFPKWDFLINSVSPLSAGGFAYFLFTSLLNNLKL